MRTASLALALIVAGTAFVLLLVVPAPALASTPAAWQPDGVPLSPVPAPRNSYDLRGLVADGSDGAYAVWQYAQPFPDFSGTAFSLAAQRVDVLGNRPAPWVPGGATIRSWIDSTPSGTYAMAPLRMLDDHAGGAILPAIDYANVVEYVTRLGLYHISPAAVVGPIPGFGGPVGGYAVLDAAADADGAGGVVMIGLKETFSLPPDPRPPSPLFVQRVDPSGIPMWPANVNAPGPELVPVGQAGFGLAALADGVGGAFYAWIDLRQPGDPDLYVQHVDAGGGLAPGWPAGGVLVCDATGAQFEPHLATDGAGGVVLVWRDERDGTSRLYANGVLVSGALAPGIPVDGRMLPSSGLDDRLVEVASDGLGGSFVVRATLTPTFTGLSYLHRLDARMQPRPGWPAEGNGLNTLSPASGLVGLVGDGVGGAFVSFRNGFGSTAPQGLYAQHFGGDGLPAAGWPSDGYRLSGTGLDSKMVRSGTGAIVAWGDTRAGGGMVFAQRLLSDIVTATELALVGASADAGAVSLRWYAAGIAGLTFTIERRTEGTSWERLAQAAADGTGQLAYVDRAVEPGVRYGYRVSWLDGATERTSGETWIAVPVGFALALEAPRPNPAAGPVSVALTLPDGRGARLEVIDLAGRQVVGRDLAGLGAGRHVVPLAEAASLAPGVYTLRLAQGGAVRLSRMCVVR